MFGSHAQLEICHCRWEKCQVHMHTHKYKHVHIFTETFLEIWSLYFNLQTVKGNISYSTVLEGKIYVI